MARIEKTVFISYRRTNIAWALAIWQNLTHSGYDVFFDYQGIPSGDFERVILENIRARAHFLVLLTPSALERVGEPGDWLRREIEAAIDSRRNVVPLTLDGFDFGAPSIAPAFAGSLAPLRHYNAVHVPPDYFEEAMHRLRDRHLNVALEAVLHPASPAAKQAVREQQGAARTAPQVPPIALTAEQWAERGYQATDADEKIRCYTEALRLKPDYAEAYNNRGAARKEKGQLEEALKDYGEALRLKPDYAEAYNNRGAARKAKGNVEAALKDYKEALRLKPDYPEAYNNRGNARVAKGDVDGALKDYGEALRLKSDYANAYYNRAIIRQRRKEYRAAIADYQRYLNLGAARPGKQAEVEEIIRDLRKEITDTR